MSQIKNTKGFHVDIPLFNGPGFRITETIFDFPNKTFHIRGLAKESGLSTTSVLKTIKALQEYNVLKLEKTDLTTNIKADLESPACLSFKRLFNLYRLERHHIISRLSEIYRPSAIVLFGSYARGEDVEGSDIDLLILTNGKDTIGAEEIAAYESALHRRISLHVLADLHKSTTEFKNNVANGIVLHGYLKVV